MLLAFCNRLRNNHRERPVLRRPSNSIFLPSRRSGLCAGPSFLRTHICSSRPTIVPLGVDCSHTLVLRLHPPPLNMLLTLSAKSLAGHIESDDRDLDLFSLPQFAITEFGLHGLNLQTTFLAGFLMG